MWAETESLSLTTEYTQIASNNQPSDWNIAWRFDGWERTLCRNDRLQTLMLMFNRTWLNKKAILCSEMFVISLTSAENMIRRQKWVFSRFFYHHFFMIHQICAHGWSESTEIPLYCFRFKLNYSFICFEALSREAGERKKQREIQIKKYSVTSWSTFVDWSLCSTSRSTPRSSHWHENVESVRWKNRA